MRIHVTSSDLGNTPRGTTLQIKRELGRGAQGIVYEAIDGKGIAHAFKNCTYGDHQIASARESIGRLARAGCPNPSFIWPTDWISCSTEDKSKTVRGYLMPLIPAEYEPCYKIVRNEVDIGVSDSIRACIHIAEAFESLHLNGLCYRDISLGNVFISANGDCLIGDVDNIAYDGEQGNNVLGTPAFMAPETVTQRTPTSVYTDLHSMGVLLFYILFRGHPLEGLRESRLALLDDEAKDNLYGNGALYIFNKHDPSNRPTNDFHPSVICMHKIMPDIVNDTFHKAFTDGLFNPGRRLVAADWCTAFRAALEDMHRCRACNAEVFRNNCWNCGEILQNQSHRDPVPPVRATRQSTLAHDDGVLLWSSIKQCLSENLSAITFALWIDSLEIASSEKASLSLRTEDEFHFHEIKRLYYGLIKDYAQRIAQRPIAIELISPKGQTFESIRSAKNPMPRGDLEA